MIRDEMMFYNRYESSKIRCISCLKANHLIQRCPYIHYTPDKIFLINRHNFSENQARNQNFLRKPKKKFKALAQLDLIDEALERLWEEDEFEESAIFGNDDDNDNERPSIEETIAIPPLEVLKETNEVEEDNNLPTPILVPSRSSNCFLLANGLAERQNSFAVKLNFKSLLILIFFT